MSEFLSEFYLWIKALHVIFVIAWMAGIFYLPRLFVYHVGAAIGGEQDKTFQVMEAKLLRIIMNPAMIGAWLFGVLLMLTPGIVSAGDSWVWVKGVAVLAMTAFHMLLARWRREFAAGKRDRPEKFYRIANEVPTLLMILIVIMVIVKPA